MDGHGLADSGCLFRSALVRHWMALAKSLKAWEGTLAADVYPIFGSLPVQAIDTALVMTAIGCGRMPAERMKVGKERRVPLSNAALTIVERMAEIRSGEFVFPGGKAGRPRSNMAFPMLLRRLGRDDLTHGFRSSFRDWAAE